MLILGNCYCTDVLRVSMHIYRAFKNLTQNKMKLHGLTKRIKKESKRRRQK